MAHDPRRARTLGRRSAASRRAAVVWAVALTVAAVGAAGCGGGNGGSDGGTDPAPAAPGANVDPGAGGVVGGSINRAKDVAGDAESRGAQLEQQGGGATSAP